jgi:hypothetical protein
MPPCDSLNGLVTLIVQSTFVPEARPPTSRVASFLATLSVGAASEPPFGTRYTVIVEPASSALESVNEPLTEATVLPEHTMTDSPWLPAIVALPPAALKLSPTFASEVWPLPVGSRPLLPGPAAEVVPASAKTSAPAARSAPIALMIFIARSFLPLRPGLDRWPSPLHSVGERPPPFRRLRLTRPAADRGRIVHEGPSRV